MSIYKILSGFKITIKNLKVYKSFQRVFRERTSKKLVNLMLSERFRETFKPKHIEILKRYKKFIKKDIIFIKYHQAKGLGRHYSNDDKSIITLPRVMKHTIMKHLGWIDVDMVSAHPNFACEVARRAGRDFEFVRQYLNNRDQILQNVIDTFSLPENPITRDEAKSLFNIMAYGGGFNTWTDSEDGLDNKPIRDIRDGEILYFINNFKRDCQCAKNWIYENNPDIVEKVKGDLEEGSDKLKRRVCSYFYGVIENEILFSLYKFLLDKNLITDCEVSLEYDGFCFKPKEDVDYQAEIDEFSNIYYDNYNFRINFKVKSYDRVRQDILDELNNFVDIEDDEELTDIEEQQSIKTNLWNTYEKCKKWFEKTHFKVINLARYFKEVRDTYGDMSVICFDKSKLIIAYEHIKFVEIIADKNGNEKESERTFIEYWVEDRNIRTYDIIDCYAPPLTPPNNCYNLWKPFRIQNLDIIIEKEDEEMVKNGVDKWLNHIKIICGNKDDEYNWFLKWLGQCLLFPAYKTFCPFFISGEGAGKGTLIKLLKKIMGQSRILETSTPERDVIGHFNQLMANAYIVILNEANAGLMRGGGIDKIKELITDGYITINGKGDKPYVMFSYHRFIGNTNSDNPLGTYTKQGDRRNAMIRSSDELIGDGEYFTQMNLLLEDDKINYGIYQHLISLEGLDTFHTEKVIQTDYHKLVKNQNKDLYLQFLEDYILQIKDNEPYKNPRSAVDGRVCVSNSVVYGEFKLWFSNKQIGEKPPNEQAFNTKLGILQKNKSIPDGSIDTRLIADGSESKRCKCFDIKALLDKFEFKYE